MDEGEGAGDRTAEAGQPHDGLFRLVFGSPEHALSELRSVLPATLLDQLDPASLAPVARSFVDGALRQRHTDALFTAQLGGLDAYLYFLIEHQSSPDQLMALRLVSYLVRIWDADLRRNPSRTRLPAIVPVVVYQGDRPWTAPLDLAGLLDIDERVGRALGELLPRARYVLDDLSGLDVAALRHRPLTPAARFTLVVFQVARGNPDVTVDLAVWFDDLRELWHRPDGRDVLAGILTYLWVVSDTPEERLTRLVAGLGVDAEEVAMTTAQRLRAEGRVEGRAEGRVEGRAELLIEQLGLKFGSLSDQQLEAIRSGTSEQITTWSARLIGGADTIDQVLR